MPERIVKISTDRLGGYGIDGSTSATAKNEQIWRVPNNSSIEATLPDYTFEAYRIDEVDLKIAAQTVAQVANEERIDALQLRIDNLMNDLDAFTRRLDELELARVQPSKEGE